MRNFNCFFLSGVGFLFFFIVTLVSCANTTKRFKLLSPQQTGILFSNQIAEELSFDILDYYFFSGAGVGIGDINNDGLKDIYFSGNLVSGKLYLNKGNFVFEDITEQAGLSDDIWGTGVSMEDINQDGFLDIYVCASGYPDESKRKNLLFINNGDLTFTESAKAYGLEEPGYSTQAVFFDYDLDNDLDIYIARNPYDVFYNDVGYVRDKEIGAHLPGSDRLFRNDGNNNYIDVSAESGIIFPGYSLGVAVSDMNMDGWPDIYLSNDFQSDDVIYINNQDGTFTNHAHDALKYTEFAGMGVSIADINNDTKPDIFVADMMPEDNQRLKMIIPTPGYDKFNLTLQKGYLPQYSRNVLQINNGDGSFSEIAQLIGVHNTDWSWAPLIADFDNDGDKDFFMTNGLLKDIGDLDFMHYQPLNSVFGTKEAKDSVRIETINKLPPINIGDYFFENKGELRFSNISKDWGIEEPSISHGAAFGDLDNDGDIDLVVSTINKEALIYDNLTTGDTNKNYIKILLKGPQRNKRGVGATVELYSKAETQHYENFPVQGYLSTVDEIIHFGLDNTTTVDSICVRWPDGKTEILKGLSSNQTITVDYANANTVKSNLSTQNNIKPLFEEVSDQLGFKVTHIEDAHTDFKLQPILIKEHSKMGPALAVGDLNGDNLDDVVVGGATGQSTNFLLQNKDGSFQKKSAFEGESLKEDMGILILDVDNDNDNDVYVVSGGTSFGKNSEQYRDRLYINDGLGTFTLATNEQHLPFSSGGSVSAADFDKDGDLDLFVSGLVVPGSYPLAPENYLLINTTNHPEQSIKNRQIFIKANQKTFSFTNELGMISSAIWTDFDNDGWTDLICVGEWNTIQILKNDKGSFKNVSHKSGISNATGWWNSISSADFDNDGDMDYIVGNFGQNNRFGVSKTTPMKMYAKDYDNNGRIDPIVSYFNNGEAYPVHTRGSLIRQINATRSRFKTYLSYAKLTMEEAFLREELEEAVTLLCEELSTVYLENKGDGTFELNPLPVLAQLSANFGIHTEDFNRDGFEDIMMVGNFYPMDVGLGRIDSSNGLILYGNGKGDFTSISNQRTGFFARKDARSLVKINGVDNTHLYAVSNNNDDVEVYKSIDSNSESIKIDPRVQNIIIYFKDGTAKKKELPYGSSYLSQSTRSISVDDKIERVILNFNDGTVQSVTF